LLAFSCPRSSANPHAEFASIKTRVVLTLAYAWIVDGVSIAQAVRDDKVTEPCPPLDPSRLEVWLNGETVWLSLAQLSELFPRDKSLLSRHIKKILDEGELLEDSVVANFATTAAVRFILRRQKWAYAINNRMTTGLLLRFLLGCFDC
jgi:hypothetical protein